MKKTLTAENLESSTESQIYSSSDNLSLKYSKLDKSDIEEMEILVNRNIILKNLMEFLESHNENTVCVKINEQDVRIGLFLLLILERSALNQKFLLN